jgi:ABC-type multidrug transport system fused ATPase/permease subunit
MAILSTLQPLIIVLVLTLTVATYFLNRGQNLYEHNNRENWTRIDRKIRYVLAKSSDFSHAKDTRLYNMQIWFTDTFSRLLKERGIWLHKIENRGLFVSACSALLSLVRDGLSYGYLIYMIYQKDMSSAAFVLYFGIITQFTHWILGIFDEASKINKASLVINDFRAFLNLKDDSNKHSETQIPAGIPSLKIENLWYRYEGSDDYAIKNFNCTVERGEKIAIVGLNGAGKTTLIKLLCKLYKPTKGRILVDDHDIGDYGRDEYFNLISAVFQDIVLMPTTIAENVAMQPYEDINHTKLDEAVCLSGLESKVKSLEMGVDTLLLKSIHSDAVDLSGGEQQKLALARAIYKGGKIIVLDEPTAALDPIAENEMYMKYNEIMKGNTSIYISHRLSSTRFCDRILFIENGTLAEQGSHEELMEKAGKYAGLFEIQSHYYKEDLPDEQAA